MLSNYYHYYSYPRLLVLLLSLLLQPQVSIVTYSYWILIVITILSTTSQLPLLLPLYITTITILFTILFVTCHHISLPKEKNTFIHFWASWIFLAVFYSLQSSHVLFCNALPTAAAFYPLCDWQLSNGCWNDWYTFAKIFAKRGNRYEYVLIGSGRGNCRGSPLVHKRDSVVWKLFDDSV